MFQVVVQVDPPPLPLPPSPYGLGTNDFYTMSILFLVPRITSTDWHTHQQMSTPRSCDDTGNKQNKTKKQRVVAPPTHTPSITSTNGHTFQQMSTPRSCDDTVNKQTNKNIHKNQRVVLLLLLLFCFLAPPPTSPPHPVVPLCLVKRDKRNPLSIRRPRELNRRAMRGITPTARGTQLRAV